MIFQSRQEAGKLLAEKLTGYKNLKDLLVLAIPRGGVVTGKEISKALNVPLDVLVTRKIGAPGNPELAIGAVGPDRIRIINWELAQQVGADRNYLENEIEKLGLEIGEREERFRRDTEPLEVTDKIVILVDDGIATGATVEAAIAWLRTKKAQKIILAFPVASPEVVEKLRSLTDELFYLEQSANFLAVGQFYQEFPQVTDEEVIKSLAE